MKTTYNYVLNYTRFLLVTILITIKFTYDINKWNIFLELFFGDLDF